MRLAAVLGGRRTPASPLLYGGDVGVDIYDVKGVVEQFFGEIRIPAVIAAAESDRPVYGDADTAMCIEVHGKKVGWFGAMHEEVLRNFGIKQSAFCIEIDLDLLTQTQATPKTFAPLPKFPSVKWDVALLVPRDVEAGEMLAAVSSSDEAIVERAEVFDIYQGKNIEKGMKSIAISITYRSAEQTLDDKTVGKVHQKIVDLLISRFNGKMREA
jgi:phenylalanyl-tRNA synthetase beta chain